MLPAAWVEVLAVVSVLYPKVVQFDIVSGVANVTLVILSVLYGL